MKNHLFVFLFTAFMPWAVHAEAITLVSEQITPSIVISPEAEDQVHYAVEDLQEYLAKITSQKLEITTQTKEGTAFAIYVGDVAANQSFKEEAKSLGRDGFVLAIQKDGVHIIGGSKFGTSYGIYELLERLGVRWFFPGEWGEVVPKSAELKMKTLHFTDKPVFKIRQMHTAGSGEAEGDWFRRNRHNRSGYYGHSSFINPKQYGKQHPEWYAEINGVRQVKEKNWKLCFSNKEMVAQFTKEVLEKIAQRKSDPQVITHNGYKHLAEDYWVISISPTDGGGFCQCAKCLAMGSLSDRLRIFNNEIAQGVRKVYPDYMVGTYEAYSEHQMPPTVKADPGVIVFPTTWTKNFFNPITDNANNAYREKIEAFKKTAPNMGLRDFDGLSVWWGYGALTLADVHRVDYPWYQEKGLQGIITEAGSGWAPWGYSYYLMGKLWWNPQADIAALKKDFIEKAYGEAAEPMKAYYALLDKAVVYPSPTSRYKMRQKLEEAAKLATDTGVKKRIDALRAHNYLMDIQESYSTEGKEKQKEVVQTFYNVLASLDPSASQFSRNKRFYRSFPTNDQPIIPLNEDALEAVLAKVELPLPGKDFPAWIDQNDLRVQPVESDTDKPFDPTMGMSFRYGPATMLFYAKGGEKVHVTQEATRWKEFATSYQLQSPELEIIMDGLAEGNTILDLEAPTTGIYTLTVSTGGRYPEIGISTRSAVVKASSQQQNVHSMGRIPEAYIYVPIGTKEFSVTSKAYEPLSIVVSGPIDRLRLRPEIRQTSQVYQQHLIEVNPGEDGKIWRLSFAGGKKNIYLEGIPPFIASSPDRLLIPPIPEKPDED